MGELHCFLQAVLERPESFMLGRRHDVAATEENAALTELVINHLFSARQRIDADTGTVKAQDQLNIAGQPVTSEPSSTMPK